MFNIFIVCHLTDTKTRHHQLGFLIHGQFMGCFDLIGCSGTWSRRCASHRLDQTLASYCGWEDFFISMSLFSSAIAQVYKVWKFRSRSVFVSIVIIVIISVAVPTNVLGSEKVSPPCFSKLYLIIKIIFVFVSQLNAVIWCLCLSAFQWRFSSMHSDHAPPSPHPTTYKGCNSTLKTCSRVRLYILLISASWILVAHFEPQPITGVQMKRVSPKI